MNKAALSAGNTVRYLLEIRQRLLWILVCYSLLFLVSFHWSNGIFYTLVKPLQRLLPQNSTLVAFNLTASLFIPIQLAAQTAFFALTPIIIFHFWRFLTPALYRIEKKTIGWTIVWSLILFILGSAFCFFIILPYLFHFFIQSLPYAVKLLPDIESTLRFILHMMYAFGICFQVPLICVLAVRLTWVTIAQLKALRSYIIVLAFIVGMLITPPDVISQLAVALPLCFLYEAGIVIASWQKKRLNASIIAEAV